jgi:tRNA(Arg) A34 adenosine deaminase TadA
MSKKDNFLMEERLMKERLMEERLMKERLIEDALMKEACNLASKSVEKGCGPFGCIITDSEYTIVAEGHNQVTVLNDPTAHAEIVTIRKACSRLKLYNLAGYKLFTSCEPCPMCLSAIYWTRITDIYYSNTRTDAKDIGFDDEYIYQEISKDINERQIKMKQICLPISMDSFNKWKELTNKKLY